MRSQPTGTLAVLCLAIVPLASCQPPRHSLEEPAQVVVALSGFLDAFESGDLDRMRDHLAPGAVSFPRSVMEEAYGSPIDVENYRRVDGLDPQMEQLIAGWRESGESPPYAELLPSDLEVRVFEAAALATFHLGIEVEDGVSYLGRRTFVFTRIDGRWKIAHIHASNVAGTG